MPSAEKRLRQNHYSSRSEPYRHFAIETEYVSPQTITFPDVLTPGVRGIFMQTGTFFGVKALLVAHQGTGRIVGVGLTGSLVVDCVTYVSRYAQQLWYMLYD